MDSEDQALAGVAIVFYQIGLIKTMHGSYTFQVEYTVQSIFLIPHINGYEYYSGCFI